MVSRVILALRFEVDVDVDVAALWFPGGLCHVWPDSLAAAGPALRGSEEQNGSLGNCFTQ